MNGTNQGKYDELTITTIVGTTISFTPVLTNSYSTVAPGLAQIVKIPQYTNVTITSTGTLTAPAWDGATGGILIFYVNGTLNIQSGGRINVTGIGFPGGTGGIGGTAGTGGAGGTGGSSAIGGQAGGNGSLGAGGGVGGEGGPLVPGLLAAGTGGNGGGVGAAGGTGANGTAGGGTNAGLAGFAGNNFSTIPSSLMMGGGGGGGRGGNGSAGAGGGGGGGSGSLLTIIGGNGTTGENGGSGGNGGNGGVGGGIVFIRAAVLTGSGTVTANGTNGTNGSSGGTGGTGGSGGKGGEKLTGLVPLNGGGGGGGGKGANGGSGGNAGGGGGSGAIYIQTLNFTGWSGLSTSVNGLSGSGGSGGAGGTGGTKGLKGRGLNLLGIGQDGNDGNDGTNGVNGSAGTSAGGGTAAGPIVLPVELINFEYRITAEKELTLYWSTASEKNSSYFSVQKSHDGRNFAEVNKVKSKGNSSSISKYSLQDVYSPSISSYYRLVNYDNDGSNNTSKVIYVAAIAEPTTRISIYPNPAEEDGIIVLTTGNTEEENFIVNFYNMQGSSVYNKKINTDQRESYEIDLPNELTPGTYHVVVNYSRGKFSEKLVIK